MKFLTSAVNIERTPHQKENRNINPFLVFALCEMRLSVRENISLNGMLFETSEY